MRLEKIRKLYEDLKQENSEEAQALCKTLLEQYPELIHTDAEQVKFILDLIQDAAKNNPQIMDAQTETELTSWVKHIIKNDD